MKEIEYKSKCGFWGYVEVSDDCPISYITGADNNLKFFDSNGSLLKEYSHTVFETTVHSLTNGCSSGICMYNLALFIKNKFEYKTWRRRHLSVVYR